MASTLMDVFSQNIEKANHLKLNKFVFLYGDDYYLVLWEKSKWSNPIKIIVF